jgi:hypothetical protein
MLPRVLADQNRTTDDVLYRARMLRAKIQRPRTAQSQNGWQFFRCPSNFPTSLISSCIATGTIRTNNRNVRKHGFVTPAVLERRALDAAKPALSSRLELESTFHANHVSGPASGPASEDQDACVCVLRYLCWKSWSSLLMSCVFL